MRLASAAISNPFMNCWEFLSGHLTTSLKLPNMANHLSLRNVSLGLSVGLEP